MIYYGIFYKDKDGFDVLASSGDYGQALVFSGQREAMANLLKYQNDINDTLNYTVYIPPKKWWQKIIPTSNQYIEHKFRSPWETEELRQKMTTSFIKKIEIY